MTMYDHLVVGSHVTFDVNGIRRGVITRVFVVDGRTFYAIMTRRRGFVEHFPRVGQPRVFVLSNPIGD